MAPRVTAAAVDSLPRCLASQSLQNGGPVHATLGPPIRGVMMTKSCVSYVLVIKSSHEPVLVRHGVDTAWTSLRA